MEFFIRPVYQAITQEMKRRSQTSKGLASHKTRRNYGKYGGNTRIAIITNRIFFFFFIS